MDLDWVHQCLVVGRSENREESSYQTLGLDASIGTYSYHKCPGNSVLCLTMDLHHSGKRFGHPMFFSFFFNL